MYEAAREVGVTRTTFYRYIKRGEIPTVRLGNRIRVSYQALLRLVDVPPFATAQTAEN